MKILPGNDKITIFLICELAPQADVTGNIHTSPVTIIRAPKANTIGSLYNFSILRILC